VRCPRSSAIARYRSVGARLYATVGMNVSLFASIGCGMGRVLRLWSRSRSTRSVRGDRWEPRSAENRLYNQFERGSRISRVVAGDPVEQEALEAGGDGNSGGVWFAGSEAGQGDDTQGFHRRPP
jgi:hypothetical protein